jgi:flavin reductase (DIM6/NTAB) family NADH-FMN oxidoreductase RutF
MITTFSNKDILYAASDYRKNLINSLTGFKSVSLIGSINSAGVTNLSPFSQIVHVGATPPLIGVLFRPNSVVRHTLENILDTGYFTINHFTTEYYIQAHHTSARWQGSEFEKCGFTPKYIDGIPAPFVAESPIQIGLELVERLDIKSNGTHFIVGEVKQILIDDKYISADGFIDLEKAGVVLSSGLDSYHTTNFLARLSYAKPDHTPKPI